jgi:hypothetical protein
MAARTRASLTDDDSISDHLTLEMVRIKGPQTPSPSTHIDPDEQITLDDSAGTIGGSSGLILNDSLTNTNPSLMEGANREYEIPNLFTYKKVMNFLFLFSFQIKRNY